MNKGFDLFVRHNVTKLFIKNMAIQESIRIKLSKCLDTSHLNIINESYMHNVPKGSETHFKVYVVSEKFKDLPLLKRHKLVNHILEDELKNNVHALSMVTLTPSEWEKREHNVEASPNCRGGFGM